MLTSHTTFYSRVLLDPSTNVDVCVALWLVVGMAGERGSVRVILDANVAEVFSANALKA